MNVKENKSVHLFYNTAKLFNTFRIISDPLKPFAPFGSSKYFWLSFTTITGRGTRRVKKLLIRFEKRSERLKKPHDQSQKKKEESVFEEAGADPKSSGRRA